MRRFVCLLIVFVGIAAGSAWSSAADNDSSQPPWATPPAMAVKRVSDLGNSQNQPGFFSNLDCTSLSFRLTDSKDMQNGCFTPTAFGFMNSDQDTVIYPETDEAIPVLPYSGHDVLAPWPQAGVLLDLSSAPVDGSYISLYKEPSAAIQNQRNEFGQVVAKQLTVPPDLQLRGPDNRTLVINPQTLAFSDGGGWLVAEDLNGSFIRINLATLDVLPFAPSYHASGSPATYKSDVAISHDGRYVAINNESMDEFKVYDLSSCDSQTASDLNPLSCKSYDYRWYAAQQIPGLEHLTHVRFINDGLISFEAASSTEDLSGVYEMAPSGSITSLINYLGMGDSYTSGEGAFDYLSGTDTEDNMCHLSVQSYPLLLTHDLFGSSGGHSVACSGAKINDVGSLSGSYRGQVKDVGDWQQLQGSNALNSALTNFTPGYISQVQFVQQYQPAIATVSVGGNDVGFGDILQECVEPKISLNHSDNDCFNTYEQRLELENLIDSTTKRWVSLYKTLQASAPGMRLYVIGYPQIALDSGDCGLNVHLSKSELEFTAELIDYLNGDIAKAAAQANLPYVDISQALDGHRLCETAGYDVAVNGLTAGKDSGVLGINVFGKESYHPNALGQELIEAAILKQTNNFKATAAPPVSSSSNPLLNAPKSGSTIYSRVPDDNLTSPIAKAGQGIAISIASSDVGLPANSTYQVHIDGPSGPVVGALDSGGTGDVSGNVTLPTDTSPGGHTIDVTGSDQTGEPIDINQPIYVPTGQTDSDGDGIPDSQDSCPYAINSGVDSDHDGIDDACNAAIGSPTTPSSTSSDSSGSDDNASNDNESYDEDGQLELSNDEITMAANLGSVNQPISRVLGETSVSPFKQTGKTIRLDSAAAAAHSKKDAEFSKLPILDWLPWFLLPILLWWLIILAYATLWLVKFIKSRTKNRLLN